MVLVLVRWCLDDGDGDDVVVAARITRRRDPPVDLLLCPGLVLSHTYVYVRGDGECECVYERGGGIYRRKEYHESQVEIEVGPTIQTHPRYGGEMMGGF